MEHFSLEGLSWELSVLSKAVAYKNLSGAASNIGISQPQLSRIVHRLEAELSGSLLDRGSKRKSSWTPLAHQIAEVYLRSVRSLNGEVQHLLTGSEPKLIHIGALEGTIPLAVACGHHILKETAVETLDLNVYDLNLLEEQFFRGDLDLIFTIREPGRKKYTYSQLLGFQILENIESSPDYRVMSSFEYGTQGAGKIAKRKKEPSAGRSKTLISNSLSVRRHWLDSFGGIGTLPSPVKTGRRPIANSTEVHLFAQDYFSPSFWEKVAKF